MKIVLLSIQKFLIAEVKKTFFEDIIVIKRVDEIFDNVEEDENFIFLHHLDLDDDSLNTLNIIVSNFNNFKAIAFRNSPNNIEGCALLKKGYKAYIHSMSNIHIIEDAIKSINNGNIWVYPELMQFLINSVPEKQTNKSKKLDLLSIKELEVLELVSQGLTNSEISEVLNIAQVTVKKHISSMFRKLELKDRLSLALFYKNK